MLQKCEKNTKSLLLYNGSGKLSSWYFRGIGEISVLNKWQKWHLGFLSDSWCMPYSSPPCLHHQTHEKAGGQFPQVGLQQNVPHISVVAMAFSPSANHGTSLLHLSVPVFWKESIYAMSYAPNLNFCFSNVSFCV